jgi:hypothetical protein
MLLFFFLQGRTLPVRQQIKLYHFLQSSSFSTCLKGYLTGLVSILKSQLFYQYVSSFSICDYPACFAAGVPQALDMVHWDLGEC